MQLTIHRGTEEIGGSCVELQTKEARILIDFGLPLVDDNKEPFDSKKIKGKSKDELVKMGILPNIKGVYMDEKPAFDGVLLSHPHKDHYGLLSYINPEIPVYLSQGCKELIEASYFFCQTKYDPKNVKVVKAWETFPIKDLKVKPFLVDHSGFDALAFLIEGDGKKLFYSGDFRGHGRKSKVFDNILKNPPKDVDYLILEGSMIGRDKGQYETEKDIETELIQRFKENKMFFISCSSQNIDRLTSIYRACFQSKRILVIDPYTAYILDKLKRISPNLPPLGKNMKIYFVKHPYTRLMAKDKSLFKFKSAKITYSEIIQNWNKIVMKDNKRVQEVFEERGDVEGSILIYSMYHGYLPELEPFWKKHHIPIIQIHTSGHAYIEELQKFVKAIKPKQIIPNHTFNPEQYPGLFGKNVLFVKDRETKVI